MKLMLLAGLMKISGANSFLSITSPVLLVSSQTTKKSVIPRLPCTSLKKGSTMFLKFALVNSSLNSNNWNLEAVDIAFSKVMNNLLTLILSNAEGVLLIQFYHRKEPYLDLESCWDLLLLCTIHLFVF